MLEEDSEEIKTEDKVVKRRKRLKLFLFKIPLVVMIVCAVLIVALKMVERYPDPLRQGFEEYLSKSTNTNATIGELKKIKFFPTVVFEAENITFHNGSNAAIIDLEIKEVKFNAPFTSLFFGSKKFNNFSLTELTSNAGFLLPQEMKIASIKVEHKKGPDQFGSFLVIDGDINKKKIFGEIEVEVGTYNYKLSNNIPFSFKIENREVSATLKRNFKDVTFENMVFQKEDQQSDAKQYELYEGGEYKNDNPLYCLMMEVDLNNCDKYLTKISE